MSNFKTFVAKTKLNIKKYSPEIFLGVGIAGTITSTVLACKATTKVDEILDNVKDMKEKVHYCLEDEKIEYTQEDANKDMYITYVQSGVKMLKLYAPALILGTISIGCIVNGHKILKKRNVALMAAYTAVDTGFKKYRANVVERFGEDIDKELKSNVRAEQITKKDKNGKEKKETVYVPVNNDKQVSEYAKFFEDSYGNYSESPEYNLMFLRKQQDYANEKLKAQGYLFLNDVYEMIGVPKTQAGQIVGWIYGDKSEGDNFVDFGIYSPANTAFVNGKESNVLLDFNVDGVIMDKIYEIDLDNKSALSKNNINKNSKLY